MNDLEVIRNVLWEHQQSPYSPFDADGCGECTDYGAWPDHAAPFVLAALRRRVETAEELDALPDGTVYLSDGHGMAEQKLGGVWYAVGTALPYEPDLPGAALWTPEGE